MKNFGSHGCIKTKSSPNPYSRIWRTHFLGLNRKESEKVLIFQCPRKVRMIFSANRSKGPPCAAGGVVESFIPLHPVAEQILSLYNTTDDGRPIFPLPNRNRLWYCIHEIGILAGVKENLSYHASRHSFGTLTLSAGVPIESISKMMGHTNIRTTQGYAKVTDDKISEDMDKLMEKRRKNLTDSGHDNQ